MATARYLRTKFAARDYKDTGGGFLQGDFKIGLEIPEVLKAVDDAARKALKEGCKVIVAGAKKTVPVRTGALRASIHYSVKSGATVESKSRFASTRVEADEKQLMGVVFTKTPPGRRMGYGGFVEVGTRTAAPKPYIRPQLQAAEAAIKAKLQGAI